jgi:hypothetical protein
VAKHADQEASRKEMEEAKDELDKMNAKQFWTW